MELMSFIPKEIDAHIYSDKIDKCFCSYEIDNCWEEFTVCTAIICSVELCIYVYLDESVEYIMYIMCVYQFRRISCLFGLTLRRQKFVFTIL